MKTATFRQAIRSIILVAIGMMISISVMSLTSAYLPTVDEVDIKVTKEASTYNPELGDIVVFTMSAENLVDDEDATNVVIEEKLPDGASYVSHSTTGGTYDENTGEWKIDLLERETKVFLTIEVEVTTVDEFCNIILFKSADQRDIAVKNNKVEICLTPEDPDVDIAVSKVASDYSPAPGQIVVFTMEAENLSGSVDATNVILEELLADGLAYIDHTVSLGVYNHISGEWKIDELKAGETAQLVIEAEVTTEEEVCNTIEFIEADQEDTKLKNNKKTICITPESPDLDLAVYKEVYNAVPRVGEQSEFTVTVTNLHNSLTATGIKIKDVLDANLELVDVMVSTGSYNENNGKWSIPQIGPGETETMVMTVIVNGSADNIARLIKVNENDVNPNNDEAMASVTVSGSSGGNDGGLESDGSLAELIAQRNFSKGKTDAKKTFNSPAELVFFEENLAKTGEIAPVSKLKSITDLVQFVPENGPFGTKAYVTTPGDLLEVSNAREVFSADYFDSENKRMAAILGLTTNGGEVYNHTKVICDRLTGASLELVKVVQVDGNSFILNKLVQANGDIDYAVSFIAYVDGDEYVIDNRWHQEEYQVPNDVEIFNFQVWSATSQSTVELMQSVITMLKEKKQINYNSEEQPEIPAVFVEKGDYKAGNIILAISNPEELEYVKVKGTLTRYENATRESFSYQLPVSIDDDGQHQVEVPTGFVFDADFSVGPVEGGKKDGLYFADGPWSKDFDRNGARIFEMYRDMHDGSSFADSYLLERNVEMNGEVKTYANLFRLLKPGNISVDLSAYGQIVFEASGEGDVELTIAKSSIENWNDQYRIRFSLSADEKTYRIDFNQLKSSLTNAEFTAEDIESVTLSFQGDGVNYESFEISLKNMRFTNGENIQPTIGESIGINMNVYPNPMVQDGFVEFNIPEDGETIIMVYDITGKEIYEVCNTELYAGNHRMNIHLDHADSGIYLVKMIFNHQVETKRINLVR